MKNKKYGFTIVTVILIFGIVLIGCSKTIWPDSYVNDVLDLPAIQINETKSTIEWTWSVSSLNEQMSKNIGKSISNMNKTNISQFASMMKGIEKAVMAAPHAGAWIETGT